MRKFFSIMLVLAGVSFITCSNSSDDNDLSDSGAEVNENEMRLENAASSILFEFCDMTDEYGFDSLPENWKTQTFNVDEYGDLYQLNAENTTEWSMAATSIQDAENWFLDLVPEDGLSESNGIYTWSLKGFGSLTFTPMKNNLKLFATLDVDIPYIPKLKKINFLPFTLIESADTDNSYSGVPYYHAGDILKSKKDESLWICVLPAGGPNKRDTSFWICLNPADKPSIFKEEKRNVTMSYKDQKKTQSWTYAKNLMSLKTAKAANFTFALLSFAPSYDKMENITYGTRQTGEYLAREGYDLSLLSRSSGASDTLADTLKGNFCFAYGRPVMDRNYKMAQNRYVQPFLQSEMKMNISGLGEAGTAVLEEIRTKNASTKSYYAITDNYDEKYIASLKAKGTAVQTPYDFHPYLHTIKDGKLGYVNPKMTAGSAYLVEDPTFKWHVIFSPELKIKDNAGNAKKASKPSAAKNYEEVFIATKTAATAAKPFEFYTLQSKVSRFIDGAAKDWGKES